MNICPGCGLEFHFKPRVGISPGGRYRKYCSDACRKRVARNSYLLPANQQAATVITQPLASSRKRTENGRHKPKANYWVFDRTAEYFGPLLQRDAQRLVKLVDGQLFEATDFSEASAAYRSFISTLIGREWLLTQSQKQELASTNRPINATKRSRRLK